jgi:hypothetical protein
MLSHKTNLLALKNYVSIYKRLLVEKKSISLFIYSKKVENI